MSRQIMDKSRLPNGDPNPIAHADPLRRDLPPNKPSTHTPGKGTGLLAVAASLLLMLAAAQGYVSFRAQYTFVDHAKHAHVPSILEALGLDTGAVIFALLALALACRGSRAAVERVLNVACALGSLTMNLLAADLGSPRSVAVWVLPSALYAFASDRLIAVVRRWTHKSGPGAGTAREGSAWQAFSGLVLWALRLLFDLRGTASGFRRWVLVVAPIAPGIQADALPGGAAPPALPAGSKSDAEEQTSGYVPPDPSEGQQPQRQEEPSGPPGLVRSERMPGETKRNALIRLYERYGVDSDPRYGDRSQAAALAAEIAGRIGYHAGTARRELAKYLASRAAALPSKPPERRPGTEPTTVPHAVPSDEPDDKAVA